jgi:hypothetical protein
MSIFKVGDYEVFATNYGHPDNHGKGLHTNGPETLFYRKGDGQWIRSEHRSLHKLRLELQQKGLKDNQNEM